MFRCSVKRLKSLLNESQYSAFQERRRQIKEEYKQEKNRVDSDRITSLYDRIYEKLILPYARQHGERVELKTRKRVVDMLNRQFRVDSEIGKVLTQDLPEGLEYGEVYKEAVEAGKECGVVQEINEYAIWINNRVYCLFDERYGERLTAKEICNDWKQISLSIDGKRQEFMFTLRNRQEIESEVDSFKGKDSQKFAEHMLNFLALN